MNTPICRLAIATLCVLASAARAQEDIPAPSAESYSSSETIEVTTSAPSWPRPHIRVHGDGNEVVSIGYDSKLAEGERADAVVSIFGSSTSEGEVTEAVVSILGNTHVTGPVGGDVVAVMGDVYVNSKVGGDAIAVIGNVKLGPQAQIGGKVAIVGGTLTRDPAAIVHGGVEQVMTGRYLGFDWLRPWVESCLLYARPLAIAPGLGWAWALAIGFLIFYVLLALMFRGAVDRCVQTLETRPGLSVVAAILTLLLTPVLFILLFITIIGIFLTPFLMMALFCAGLFGKAVILAAIGRRFTRFFGNGPLAHTAMAVSIGGLIVLVLYVIPVIGFIAYKLIGFLGLGVVVYTLILSMKSAKTERVSASAPAVAATAFPDRSAPASSASPDATAFATSGASTADATSSVDPTAPTAAVATTALPHAGFWVRMGALLIDIILVAVILSPFDDIGAIPLLAVAAYGALMWKLKGTTIGGIVFNLKVVRQDGRLIDWATAIVRALSCFLSLIVAGLGFIWIALDEEKQAWHDKIAGTVVVRMPKGVSLL